MLASSALRLQLPKAACRACRNASNASALKAVRLFDVASLYDRVCWVALEVVVSGGLKVRFEYETYFEPEVDGKKVFF